MEDPFPPADPEYSLKIPEVLAPIRHPDFSSKNHQDKMEIIVDEMLIRDKNTSVEYMLSMMGVTLDEYKAVVADKEYIRLLKQKSTSEILAPFIPAMFEELGRGAANGDDTKMKNMLQTIGSMIPENVTLQNIVLNNMSDKELAMEAARLARDLEKDAE